MKTAKPTNAADSGKARPRRAKKNKPAEGKQTARKKRSPGIIVLGLREQHDARTGSSQKAGGMVYLCGVSSMDAPRVQRGLFKMIRQFSVAAEQTVLLCPCDAVLKIVHSFAIDLDIWILIFVSEG